MKYGYITYRHTNELMHTDTHAPDLTVFHISYIVSI